MLVEHWSLKCLSTKRCFYVALEYMEESVGKIWKPRNHNFIKRQHNFDRRFRNSYFWFNRKTMNTMALALSRKMLIGSYEYDFRSDYPKTFISNLHAIPNPNLFQLFHSYLVNPFLCTDPPQYLHPKLIATKETLYTEPSPFKSLAHQSN